MTDKLDKLIDLIEGLSLRVKSLEEEVHKNPIYWRRVGADPIVMKTVVQVVSKLFAVSEHAIAVSRCRWDHIALARQVAMTLTKQFGCLGFKETSRLFKRVHGTVMCAEKAVKDRRATDKAFRQRYADAERLINEQLQEHYERTNSKPPSLPGPPKPVPEGTGHTQIPPPVGQVDRSP